MIGMPRSGAGVITRGLQVLGVSLGKDLLHAPAGVNEKGCWQDRDVAEFNNLLLAALGRQWDSLLPMRVEELLQARVAPFRRTASRLLRSKLCGAACFGLKDPRMPRLLPFWHSVFANLALPASYVVVYRNPKNVAHSLARRDGFALEKGYLLWLDHMLCSMRHTQNQRRVFVDYDKILSNPSRELARISRSLDLPMAQAGPAFEEYAVGFLDNSLRHHLFDLDDLCLDPAAPSDVIVLNQLLLDLTIDGGLDDVALALRLDDLQAAQERQLALYRLAQQCIGRLTEYDERLCGQDRQLQELDDHRGLQERLLQERDDLLRVQEVKLRERDDLLRVQSSQLAECEEQLRVLDNLLNEFEDQLRVQECQLKACEEQLRVQGQLLSERADMRAQSDVKRLDVRASVLRLSGSLRNLLNALALRVSRWPWFVRLRRRFLYRWVMKSGLFVSEAYLKAYPDVSAAGVDPLTHFMTSGWREGRNPSSLFTTQAYLDTYDDVRTSGLNPLVHYLYCGQREQRAIQTIDGEWIFLEKEEGYLDRIIAMLNLRRLLDV